MCHFYSPTRGSTQSIFIVREAEHVLMLCLMLYNAMTMYPTATEDRRHDDQCRSSVLNMILHYSNWGATPHPASETE